MAGEARVVISSLETRMYSQTWEPQVRGTEQIFMSPCLYPGLPVAQSPGFQGRSMGQTGPSLPWKVEAVSG